MRKKVLARSLVARAGAHVKRHAFQEAKADLMNALQADPAIVNGRWRVLRVATMFPFVTPILLSARKLIPRRSRHSGV
jgi:hypothetical protein